jgi:hypothetical protein
MPNTQLHEQPVTLTEREPAISSKTRGKIHTLAGCLKKPQGDP